MISYTAGTKALHRLHPLTKLAGAVLIIAATYTLPGLLTPLALFAVVLALAAFSGITRSFLRTVLLALLPITFSLFLIQGILFPPANATPLGRLGPITLTRES